LRTNTSDPVLEVNTMKTTFPKIACLTPLLISAAMCLALQNSETPHNGWDPFPYAQSRKMNGHTMVPVRGVFEHIGGTVHWDPTTRTVTAQREGLTLTMKLGSQIAYVNGREVPLSVPIQMFDGNIMAPRSFLDKCVGAYETANVPAHPVTFRSQVSQQNPNPQIRLVGDSANWMRKGTIIPVMLSSPFLSDSTENGTKISATLNASDEKFGPPQLVLKTTSSRGRREDGADMSATLVPSTERYGPLPPGTTILGHVVSAARREDSELGKFVLIFDRIRTPDGKSYSIDGSPFSLDAETMDRSGSGILTTASEADPIWMPNQKLVRGARFGVRLNRDLELSKG